MPISVARFIKSLDGKKDPYCLLDGSYAVGEIPELMDDEDLFDDGERRLSVGTGTHYLHYGFRMSGWGIVW